MLTYIYILCDGTQFLGGHLLYLVDSRPCRPMCPSQTRLYPPTNARLYTLHCCGFEYRTMHVYNSMTTKQETAAWKAGLLQSMNFALMLLEAFMSVITSSRNTPSLAKSQALQVHRSSTSHVNNVPAPEVVTESSVGDTRFTGISGLSFISTVCAE